MESVRHGYSNLLSTHWQLMIFRIFASIINAHCTSSRQLIKYIWNYLQAILSGGSFVARKVQFSSRSQFERVPATANQTRRHSIGQRFCRPTITSTDIRIERSIQTKYQKCCLICFLLQSNKNTTNNNWIYIIENQKLWVWVLNYICKNKMFYIIYMR